MAPSSSHRHRLEADEDPVEGRVGRVRGASPEQVAGRSALEIWGASIYSCREEELRLKLSYAKGSYEVEIRLLCFGAMPFVPVRNLSLASLPSRIRLDGFTLFVVGAAVLGAGLVLARHVEHGVGLSWDSVTYIGVARNLLAGEGFVELTGRAYTLWAPLYPMLLAAAGALGVDPQDAAGPLNAAAFGAAVAISGFYLRDRLASRFLAAWGALAAALSIPLAWAASVALVTIPLSALTLLALIQIEKFLREQQTRALLLASIFSSLAFAIHYRGIILLVFAAGLLALQQGAVPTRIRRIAVYGTIASAPMAAWSIRNTLLVGSATGPRGLESDSFFPLLVDAINRTSQWAFVNLFVDNLYFEEIFWPIASFFTGAALSAVALTAVYAFAQAARSRNETEIPPFAVFAGFSIAYLLLLTLSITLGYAAGPGDRFLIPAYIPLLIGLLIGLDGFLLNIRNKGKPYAKRLSVGTLAALCLWLAFSAALQPLAIREANANGIGRYDGLRDSEVLRYIQDNASNLIERETQSNDVWAVYAGSRGRTPAVWIDTDSDGAVILWFHDKPHAKYDAAELRGMPRVETLANLADGAVFVVNKARSASVYQSAYDALIDREPPVRSVFDVHFDGRTLAYAKFPCARGDTAARFFLHVTPVDADDLPAERRNAGFDNLDFSFVNIGARFDEKCIASVRLPNYPVEKVKTGQFAGDEWLWEANFPVDESP